MLICHSVASLINLYILKRKLFFFHIIIEPIREVVAEGYKYKLLSNQRQYRCVYCSSIFIIYPMSNSQIKRLFSIRTSFFKGEYWKHQADWNSNVFSIKVANRHKKIQNMSILHYINFFLITWNKADFHIFDFFCLNNSSESSIFF